MINIHTKLIQDDLPEMGVDAFAILICITAHINAKKRAWPGIDRLRKMTGLSKERTYAAIAKLIALNHIERKQQNVKGEWGKVVYRLTTQYLGVYVGVSEFPMEEEATGEPLAGNTEHGYPEHGYPEHGKAASISIVQDGSISKEEVLVKKEGGEAEKIPPPVVENPNALQWGDGAEMRLEKANALVRGYILANPERLRDMCRQARNRCNETGFWDELGEYLRHHADNYQIMQNPVKALTSGPSNFVSWLSKPWCRDKYLTAQPDQPKRRATSTPQPERERMTPEQAMALREKYAVK